MSRTGLFKRGVLILISLLFLLFVSLGLGMAYFLQSPAGKGGELIFEVSHGESLREVAGRLETKKIIKSDAPFLLWARVMGYSSSIKAGEYRLGPSSTPIEILDILTKGRSITYTVTIPEGFNMRQIADLLDKEGICERDDFLKTASGRKNAKQHGITGDSLEGYLFPDTYKFEKSTPAPIVTDTMVGRFADIWEELGRDKSETGLSDGEIVILASIVEKETGCAKERPIIASVFLNRLRNGMRLDSDPTVIYGMSNFSGNLTKKDLLTPSRFNTYINRGLPPAPIANPGRDALRAVLHPEKTDFFYFVSKNDGTHHFSKDLKEHNRAVYKYQKMKRSKGKKG